MKVPKTLVQGIIYSLAKMLSKLFSFLAVLIFAKAVGPSHYGVYTYIMSTVLLFQPFSNLGMGPEIVRRSKSRLKHVEEAFLTLILLSLLFSILVAFSIFFSGYSVILSALSALLFLSINFSNLMITIHMIKGRVRFISVSSILEKMVFFILVLLLPKKTSFFIASIIFSAFLSSMFLFSKINFAPKLKLTFEYISKYFFLSSVFTVVASKLPVIIYKHRFGVYTLGNFGIALTVYQAISYVLSQLNSFVFVRASNFDKKRFLILKKMSVFSSIMVVLFSIILSFFIRPLFSYLGEDFSSSGKIFTFLVAGLGVNFLSMYVSTVLAHRNPEGFMKMYFVYMVLAVIFAFLARDIFEASILRVVSAYIYILYGFFLAEKSL